MTREEFTERCIRDTKIIIKALEEHGLPKISKILNKFPVEVEHIYENDGFFDAVLWVDNDLFWYVRFVFQYADGMFTRDIYALINSNQNLIEKTAKADKTDIDIEAFLRGEISEPELPEGTINIDFNELYVSACDVAEALQELDLDSLFGNEDIRR
jgi:hypothetical protein